MGEFIVISAAFSFLINYLLLTCCLTSKLSLADGFMHPLTNIPSPSYQIYTSYYFPNLDEIDSSHSQSRRNQESIKLPIGKSVTILCHLTNRGKNAFNVTAVMGSLNHVYDFRHFIQNYTYQPYGTVLKPTEELTVQYTFEIHPELEATEYTLAHTVFYENDRDGFASTFFNQTVLLYFPTTEYDLLSVIQVIFSILCTFLVLVGAFMVCAPGGRTEQAILAKSAQAIKKSTYVNPNDSWTSDDSKPAVKKGKKKA